MATAANAAGMRGSILAEAVQIDGGMVVLFLLVMLAACIAFTGLCWAAYKAGAGNRMALVVVGLASLYFVVLIFTFGINAVIPLAILAGFAWMGRARSKR